MKVAILPCTCKETATIMDPYASIIPLNYQSHLEFSIFVFDPVWENLVDLLSNPQTVLKGWSSARWNQAAVPPGIRSSMLVSNKIPWNLNTPAVAVIRPLTLRPDLAPLISGLKNQADYDEGYHYTEQVQSGDQSIEDWQKYIQGVWTDPADLFFRQGFYIAEFAVDTAALMITYLPPATPTSFYQKGFSPVTVATLGVNIGTPANPLNAVSGFLTSVHVDLTPAGTNAPAEDQTPTTLVDRARFAVDLLSSRRTFTTMLNGANGYIYPYPLFPGGSTMSVSPPIPGPNPIAAQGAKFESAPLFPPIQADFPSMTIEGLTSPKVWRSGPKDLPADVSSPTVDTCVITSTTYDSVNRAFTLKDVTIKTYGGGVSADDSGTAGSS